MNKQQYAKHIGKSSIVTKESIRKDKRFYKKRIFDLTKKLLNNEKPETMYPDVGSAFDSYAKVCIEYFKVLDKSDIIQEDYAGIENGLFNNLPADPSYNSVEESMIIMRSIKITEPNALEKLVKRTTSKLEKNPIIPIQKDINLKDPTLKNKGISKKNNINSKYEETHEKDNSKKTGQTGQTENPKNNEKTK
jgi:hypothetical protein